MAELKPCPFCGGKAELRQEDFDPRWMPTRNDPDSGGCPPYYVKCDDCGANTEYRYAYPDAVKLWNRRSDVEAKPVRHGRWIEIEHYKAHGEPYCDCLCSECGHRISRVRGFYPNFCEDCGTQMNASYTADGGEDDDER